MKIVRRRIWSRFWGLVAVISVTSFAAALALAGYEPNMARGVRVLGSFLERIPVRAVHRKPAPAEVPVSPTAIKLPAVTPPAMPLTEATAPSEEPVAVQTVPVLAPNVPAAASAVAAPEAAKAAEVEEWYEEDELHDDDDEMPSAPSEAP